MYENPSSGVAFPLVQTVLGIPKWSMKPVYSYARDLLLRTKSVNDYSIRKESGTNGSSEIDRELWTLASVMLVYNGSAASCWAVRKQCLLASSTDARSLPEQSSLDEERVFVNAVLCLHPKAGEAWEHRKWLLGLAMASMMDKGPSSTALAHGDDVGDEWEEVKEGQGTIESQITEWLEKELEGAKQAATRWPKNYHAWTYRGRVSGVIGAQGSADSSIAEVEAAEASARASVSDHAAQHHCAVALASWMAATLNRAGWELDAASAAFKTVQSRIHEHHTHTQSLITRYHGHSALWAHLRWSLSVDINLFTDFSVLATPFQPRFTAGPAIVQGSTLIYPSHSVLHTGAGNFSSPAKEVLVAKFEALLAGWFPWKLGAEPGGISPSLASHRSVLRSEAMDATSFTSQDSSFVPGRLTREAMWAWSRLQAEDRTDTDEGASAISHIFWALDDARRGMRREVEILDVSDGEELLGWMEAVLDAAQARVVTLLKTDAVAKPIWEVMTNHKPYWSARAARMASAS